MMVMVTEILGPIIFLISVYFLFSAWLAGMRWARKYNITLSSFSTITRKDEQYYKEKKAFLKLITIALLVALVGVLA